MKVAFLDRDGVINKEVNYLHKIEDFEFTENCIDGLKLLREKGYEIVIVTNQAGIARGYYNEKDYLHLTQWYLNELKAEGISILDVLFCPHHPEGVVPELSVVCECRKPNNGMLEKAIKDYSIDRNSSLLIGDKESDILAGKKAKLNRCYLVRSGHPVRNINYDDVSIKDTLFHVAQEL